MKTVNKQLRIARLRGGLPVDSLAMTPHWIYDQSENEQCFARVDGLLEPAETIDIVVRDCALMSALTAVIYLLRWWKGDAETLIENMTEDGDASRGLILRVLLALMERGSWIPKKWRIDLQYQINT